MEPGNEPKVIQELIKEVEDLDGENDGLMRRIGVLEAAIRKHRDQRGDDRCWLDDEELYKVLPEGYTPPVRDSAVELKMCEKFIACRHNPNTQYVSPQRRIEELETELQKLKESYIPYMARDACASCGDTIVWNGSRWQHLSTMPRHIPTPTLYESNLFKKPEKGTIGPIQYSD
jgi:hypothetical protein